MFSKYIEYKTRIKFIDIEIDDMISIGSKSEDPLPGKVTARTNTSVVERQAEKISELQQEKRELERELRRLDSIIELLPDEYRDVVKLRYVEGIEVNELATRFNLTNKAIYKKLSASRKYVNKFSTTFIPQVEHCNL